MTAGSELPGDAYCGIPTNAKPMSEAALSTIWIPPADAAFHKEAKHKCGLCLDRRSILMNWYGVDQHVPCPKCGVVPMRTISKDELRKIFP